MTTSQHSRKWIVKMQRQKRCAVCGGDLARSCQNKSCPKLRKRTKAEVCPNCGNKTTPHRLCPKHLKQDKHRAAAARAKRKTTL